MKETFILNHKVQIDYIAEQCELLVNSGVEHEIIFQPVKKQRSIPQNRSVHQYFSLMSEEMNDAGITQKDLTLSFKDGFELPVTPGMIKDIFRAVGFAMFKKKSTSDLDSKEIQKVHQVVDQRFGEVTGVTVPWPSDDPPIYEGVK